MPSLDSNRNPNRDNLEAFFLMRDRQGINPDGRGNRVGLGIEWKIHNQDELYEKKTIFTKGTKCPKYFLKGNLNKSVLGTV